MHHHPIVTQPPRHPLGQNGVSLVEVLLGLLLSAFLLGGILQLHASSKQSYRVSETVARLQENARYAMETMARDLRQAGQLGCDPRGASYANATVTSPSDTLLQGTLGIQGYQRHDSGHDSLPPEVFSTPLDGTDALIIRRASSKVAIVKNHDMWDNNTDGPKATPKIYYNGDLSYVKQHDPMVVASDDCKFVGIFCATNDPSTYVGHDKGTPQVNCTPALVGNWTCASGAPGTSGSVTGNDVTRVMRYNPNSTISRLEATGYYIKRRGASDINPALYRVRSHDCVTAASDGEELVEGVEGLSILYGLDTDGDSGVDDYRRADAITTNVQWGQVVAINIELLLVSTGFADDLEQKASGASRGDARTVISPVEAPDCPGGVPRCPRQALRYGGQDRVYYDGRLRLVHSFTVNLRNRVP